MKARSSFKIFQKETQGRLFDRKSVVEEKSLEGEIIPKIPNEDRDQEEFIEFQDLMIQFAKNVSSATYLLLDRKDNKADTQIAQVLYKKACILIAELRRDLKNGLEKLIDKCVQFFAEVSLIELRLNEGDELFRLFKEKDVLNDLMSISDLEEEADNSIWEKFSELFANWDKFSELLAKEEVRKVIQHECDSYLEHLLNDAGFSKNQIARIKKNGTLTADDYWDLGFEILPNTQASRALEFYSAEYRQRPGFDDIAPMKPKIEGILKIRKSSMLSTFDDCIKQLDANKNILEERRPGRAGYGFIHKIKVAIADFLSKRGLIKKVAGAQTIENIERQVKVFK